MLRGAQAGIFGQTDKGLDKGAGKAEIRISVRGRVENKPQGKKWKELRRAGMLAAIPALLAIGPILGWFLGDFLDSRLGSSPWLSYLGILIGFVAAGREVYRLAKRAGEE